MYILSIIFNLLPHDMTCRSKNHLVLSLLVSYPRRTDGIVDIILLGIHEIIIRLVKKMFRQLR